MSTLSRLVRHIKDGRYSHPLLTVDSFLFPGLWFGAYMTSRKFRSGDDCGAFRGRTQRDQFIKIAPIDHAPGARSRVLLPAGSGWSHPPRHCDAATAPPPHRVDFPAVKMAVLTNHVVEAGCSYPFDPQRRLLLVDEEFLRLPANGSAVTGYLFAHGRSRAVVRLRGALTPAPDGVFLGGNGSSNCYHWLIEIVTKLHLLPLIPEADGMPLLVSKRVAEVAPFRDALRMVAPERELFLLEEGLPYQVRNAICIEPLVGAPFHITDCKFRAEHFLARPEAVRFLRDAVLPKAAAAGHAAWPRRVFLARGARRSYNQDELVAVAAEHGFVPLRMEEHSFAEQAAIFANANAIIGPTGAAWSNLVFAGEHCTACCWLPEELEEFSAFSNLAAIVGVDYRHFTYPSGVRTPSDVYGHSYRIAPEDFRRMLERLFPCELL